MPQSEYTRVVSLFGRSREMNDAKFIELLTYWEGLRNGRIIPPKAAFNTDEIPHAAAHCFVLQRTKEDTIVFRHTGDALWNVLGMDLFSMPAYACIAPDDRETFNAVLNSVLENIEMIELVLSGELINKQRISAAMLLLPVFAKDKSVSRIFGCLSISPKNYPAPVRFEIEDVKTTRIVAGKSSLDTTDEQGFEEPRTSFKPVPQTRIENSHAQGAKPQTPGKTGRVNFRVIKGDKAD